MEGIAKFFAMGGYAVYVWPAVGLTVVVMVVLAWQSWRSLRDAERAVAEQERQLKQATDDGAGSDKAGADVAA